jgi:hypothetical protein
MKTERSEPAEQAYRRRYNRTVTVEQGRELNTDSSIKQARTTITSKYGKTYILDEYLINGLTDYVTTLANGITRNFNSYLAAEIYVADEIGKES